MYNAHVKAILALFACALCALAADIRIGVIGTDTSHVPAFTKMLNGDPNAPDHIAGARVVAAYKGGSKDIEESIGRVDRYADEVKTAVRRGNRPRHPHPAHESGRRAARKPGRARRTWSRRGR